MTRDELKRAHMAWRLLNEFPEWDTAQAEHCAEVICATAETMAFELEVESWLSELPVTELQ